MNESYVEEMAEKRRAAAAAGSSSKKFTLSRTLYVFELLLRSTVYFLVRDGTGST